MCCHLSFRKPFKNSLSRSVHPCTLFSDIYPCMSEKDEFCTQNSLLINTPPIIRGRSELSFSVSLLKIACPEVYIRVHFWTRVFALQKHRCCGIHGHPCPFCRYKAQAQINRRHGKKCTSCTFFTYVFAAQTRCCVEPPPSMAVLLR